MENYTKSEMIVFALYFALACIEARSNKEPVPNASTVFEKWKIETEKE